eukprot:932358-Prorocentrum_minimum.AAC.1
MSCLRSVRLENIPAWHVSDWSVVRIYLHCMCPIGAAGCDAGAGGGSADRARCRAQVASPASGPSCVPEVPIGAHHPKPYRRTRVTLLKPKRTLKLLELLKPKPSKS